MHNLTPNAGVLVSHVHVHVHLCVCVCVHVHVCVCVCLLHSSFATSLLAGAPQNRRRRPCAISSSPSSAHSRFVARCRSPSMHSNRFARAAIGTLLLTHFSSFSSTPLASVCAGASLSVSVSVSVCCLWLGCVAETPRLSDARAGNGTAVHCRCSEAEPAASPRGRRYRHCPERKRTHLDPVAACFAAYSKRGFQDYTIHTCTCSHKPVCWSQCTCISFHLVTHTHTHTPVPLHFASVQVLERPWRADSRVWRLLTLSLGLMTEQNDTIERARAPADELTPEAAMTGVCLCLYLCVCGPYPPPHLPHLPLPFHFPSFFLEPLPAPLDLTLGWLATQGSLTFCGWCWRARRSNVNRA